MNGASVAGTALLVIDMQNDFCHLNGVYGTSDEDVTMIGLMTDRLLAGAAAWRNRGGLVVHVRTEHSDRTDSPQWLQRGESTLPRACRLGSWGAEPFGVIPRPGEPVVVKTRYSGFYGTRLEQLLRERGVSRVFVAGVLTNVCVETTIREGCLRDLAMVLLEDCCGTYDRKLHDASVENVRRYFGQVRTSAVLGARSAGI